MTSFNRTFAAMFLIVAGLSSNSTYGQGVGDARNFGAAVQGQLFIVERFGDGRPDQRTVVEVSTPLIPIFLGSPPVFSFESSQLVSKAGEISVSGADYDMTHTLSASISQGLVRAISVQKNHIGQNPDQFTFALSGSSTASFRDVIFLHNPNAGPSTVTTIPFAVERTSHHFGNSAILFSPVIGQTTDVGLERDRSFFFNETLADQLAITTIVHNGSISFLGPNATYVVAARTDVRGESRSNTPVAVIESIQQMRLNFGPLPAGVTCHAASQVLPGCGQPDFEAAFINNLQTSELFTNRPLRVPLGQTNVGTVQEIQGGGGLVHHADGSVESIAIGTQVLMGDIIETGTGQVMSILFVDGSQIVIDENARIQIDRYVFDPNPSLGFYDWLQRLFVYTSGLIGKTEPEDVETIKPIMSGGGGIRASAEEIIREDLLNNPDATLGDVGIWVETASPNKVSTFVDLPEGQFRLKFGYIFLHDGAQLTVALGDTQAFSATATPDAVGKLQTVDMGIDSTGGRSMLSFQADGSAGKGVIITGLTVPGASLSNLDGWYRDGQGRVGFVYLTTDEKLDALVQVATERAGNTRPTANAGADQTRNEGGLVTLDGAASLDPNGDSLSYFWRQISGLPVILNSQLSAITSFTAPLVGPGGADLEFELTVTDNHASDPKSATDRVVVHVMNSNDPPACALARAVPDLLWPPNQEFVRIRVVGLSDPNNDTVRITITSITQDEPVTSRRRDDRTSPDSLIKAKVAGSVLFLRAERAGNGNGRVYRVSFSASDGLETCAGAVRVSVPHHKKKSVAIDDGQLYDSTVK